MRLAVSVEFEWKHLGRIVLDGSHMLLFPRLSSGPGLYRFTVGDGVYIGEAAQLARRMQHYRTPGPKQQTNLRMNQLMLDHLGDGATLELAISTEAVVVVNGSRRAADLDSKAERVLVEHAALVALTEAGLRCLNRAVLVE